METAKLIPHSYGKRWGYGPIALHDYYHTPDGPEHQTEFRAVSGEKEANFYENLY